jgi:class 3 adenylate cyclase
MGHVPTKRDTFPIGLPRFYLFPTQFLGGKSDNFQMDKHYDLNPLTLQFPLKTERLFRSEQYVLTRRTLKVVWPAVMIGVSVAQYVIQPLVDAQCFDSFLRLFVNLLVTAFTFAIPAFYMFAPKRAFVLGNALAMVLSLFYFVLILMIFDSLPDERHRYAFGLLSFLLVVHGTLPYDWRFKMLINCFLPVALYAMEARNAIIGPTAQLQVSGHLLLTAFFMSFVGYLLEKLFRQQWILRAKLHDERARSDAVLTNALPTRIAERLKLDPSSIVENYSGVSVIFVDIVGFTKLAESLSANEIVNILNDIFSRFDTVASSLGVEKIKTIGDAYMAVAGIPDARSDHAIVAAEMALDLREAFRRYCLISGFSQEIRIGIASGPVVAGIIGKNRFLYDLWGDTVNVASRMESTGIPGEIQIAQSTRLLLGEAYDLEERGLVEIKGKGRMPVWILKRPKLVSG